MIDLAAILTAFHGKIVGDATLMALLGDGVRSVNQESPPDKRTYPLINWFLVSGASGGGFSERYEQPLIQVDCYTKDTATARAGTLMPPILKQLTTTLDDCSLTVSGYSAISCQRQGVPLPVPEEGAEYAGIRHFVVQYRLELSRPR